MERRDCRRHDNNHRPRDMPIDYHIDDPRLDARAFLALVQRVWPGTYDETAIARALARTTNIGAWDDARLVGTLRLLTDGYLFATVPELLVDPAYQRRGIGRRLLQEAIVHAPRGRLFLGAQPGNEPFFERVGLERGPVGFVARRERLLPIADAS